MAVTFTAAAERDRRHALERTTRGHGDPALVATSCFIALLIVFTYVGRFAIVDRAERLRSIPPIDVETVHDAQMLAPGLVAAFADPNDRRFAAEQWWAYLSAEKDRGRPIASIAAATRATVLAKTIDQSTGLDVFARRLAVARDAAAAAGQAAVDALPLFASADVAALKPSFIVRTRQQFRNQVVLWSTLYIIGFHIVVLTWRVRHVDGDRLLLALAHLLTGIGFAILLSRPDPLRDAPLFVRFAEGTTIGLALMLALSLIDFGEAIFLELSYVPLLGAVALCAVLIVFGAGPGRSGAKVNLGPIQPIEAIKVLLALFLAGYFARRWELLRGVRARAIRAVRLPAWIDVPRGEHVLPVLGGVVVALALFAIQRDLGPALLLCVVFLAMYAIARGRIGMAGAGFVLLVAGFYVGHRVHLSHTLSERVLMWQSPWNNTVAGGDQVAQAIWAMSAGGPLGSGVGLGDTRYLPAGHTDLVLGAVAEEFGVVGFLVIAMVYAVLAWRGFRIARSAPTDYGFFLATALTLFLIVPVLVMAAGITGVIPLTGVVTPFLSYGGSAMAANLAAVGILSSIHADRRGAADLSVFNPAMRCAAGLLAIVAAVMVAVVVNIQVLHADEYLAHSYLGLQADGGRRYAYNPRLIEVARQIPRGTIFDRRGLPLATSDPAVVARARAEYQKLGISLDDACSSFAGRILPDRVDGAPPDRAASSGRIAPDSTSARCYPLGGRAFHLLGDVRTRANWGAPNTSYVERDAESALRGFDDHATVVATTDAAGRPMSTVRRDYRALVPMFRHRYQPDHPNVIALSRRSHDVHSTIDAALQLRVTSIVESSARKGSGRAAAIVLDPDSGALLASASYPWPAVNDRGEIGGMDDAALLDRARYGLYPPGSTFKLVTAAAALGANIDSARTMFTCTRLPDGRIGARLPGWIRPVRDDVLDTRPHGTIDMHDGLVHSCNAYFAQLAMKIGPQRLLECATRLGIALTPSGAPLARIRQTLPQVGYGQAEVLATPLRMARVAAAIASSGTLHDVIWNQADAATTDHFISPAAARVLSGYMRDVVLSGTGSSLKTSPWPIAGKTGTAELAGAPSHGWFVGYAPYGPATKRIAFAVVIEHAGYGGRTAAPVAGEIVAAAAASGLLRENRP